MQKQAGGSQRVGVATSAALELCAARLRGSVAAGGRCGAASFQAAQLQLVALRAAELLLDDVRGKGLAGLAVGAYEGPAGPAGRRVLLRGLGGGLSG